MLLSAEKVSRPFVSTPVLFRGWEPSVRLCGTLGNRVWSQFGSPRF